MTQKLRRGIDAFCSVAKDLGSCMLRGKWYGQICVCMIVHLVVLNQVASGQVEVSGTVISAQDNVSLPGVNVSVKGTTVGTATGLDGQYSLIAPNANDTLVLSYVGFIAQEVPIEGRSVVDVSLEVDIAGLDEVVVVGYGAQRELTMTGAVSSVGEDQISAVPVGDAESRLQGRVAGVTVTQSHSPSGGSVVRVRGIGSINDNDPLYVVDGVPANNLDTINPNDIESMTVLKDASSSAIYGSRAANGVIVVTTARGQRGRPLAVNFSARTAVQQPIRWLELLDAQELGEKKWQEKINDGYTVGHPSWGDPQYGDGATPVIPYYTFPGGASQGDPTADEGLYNYGDPYYGITIANSEGTDWQDEIFETGSVQEYNLGISGGGTNSNFAVSGGFMQNDGIMMHTGFERYSLRANSDFGVASWLDLGQSLGVTYTERLGSGGNGPIDTAMRISPLLPVHDIMGNFSGTKSPGTSNAGNPVASLVRNKNDYDRDTRVLANAYAQVTPLEGLSLRTLLGVDLASGKSRNYDLADPEFTQTNFGNGLSESENRRLQYNWANTLTYGKAVGGHDLGLLLGTEAVSNNTESFGASRSTYAFEDIDYMILSTGEESVDNDGRFDEWSLFSYFGRFNYNFQEKYLLEAVLRRDGSSRFAAENRWGTFPAVSVGWRLLEDLGEISFVDDLKLRAGWGKNGNDNVGNYNAYSTYRSAGNASYYNISGASTNSSVAGFHQFNLGNPSGRWEASVSTNIGLDLNLFNYKFEAHVDVYRRLTTDMLYPDQRPATWGALSFPNINIGEMKNTGVDLMLSYTNGGGPVFDYTISANASHYKNEIIRLNDNPNEFRYGASELNDPYTINMAGLPVSSLYGYVVEGIFNTQGEVDAWVPYLPNAQGVDTYSRPGVFKYRDANGDGVISPDDRTIIGNPHPDLTYGLNIDLGFRNTWDLTLFFLGSYGNDILNHARRELLFNRYDGNYLRERLYESWTPERYANGETISVPITTNEDGIIQRPSTFLLEDGSYFKLKDLQLGYSLPSSLVSKLNAQRIRVYFQATNLFTITGYNGLDPELSTGNDRGIGVDSGIYPTSRIYTAGLDVNF
jgi:TonB-linked SusC/RagA family outer membrane protein